MFRVQVWVRVHVRVRVRVRVIVRVRVVFRVIIRVRVRVIVRVRGCACDNGLKFGYRFSTKDFTPSPKSEFPLFSDARIR